MTLISSVSSTTPGDHQDVAFTLAGASRIAIGAGINRLDMGSGNTVSIDIKQGGTSLSGYPVSLDLERNLDNISSPNVDPVQASHVTDELSAGAYTYSVTSGTGSPTVRTSGVQSADAASGTVCPHTFSSHSSPTVWMQGGSLYGIHAEINTGDRYLSNLSSPIGQMANAIGSGQDEVLDVHHQTGTGAGLSDGRTVSVNLDHNGVVRFLVADTPAGLLTASGTDLSPASREATYSQTVVLSDDTVKTHNRVRDASGLGHRCYFVDPDDPASAVQDVLGTSSQMAEQAYPVWSELHHADDGSDLVIDGYQPRGTDTDWNGLGVMVWDSSEGANGRYYSVDGSASSTATLGTTGTPRLTQAKFEDAVGSGGFRILDNTGTGQVYIPGNVAYHVNEWNGSTKRVDVLIPWVDAPTLGGFNDNTSSSSDKCELRLSIAKGATVITTTADTDPVIDPFNTIRLGCCVIWKDGVTGGTALLLVTNLGNYSDGVTGNPYYKWGGPSISLYEIAEPFGATSAAELAERVTAKGVVYTAEGLTCANIDPVHGAVNMVSFQEAYEGVRPTGRQSVLRVLDLGSGGGFRNFRSGRDFRSR